MNLTKDFLVLAGALAGGLVGYFVFKWLLGQGYYGLMLPGGFLGIVAGVFKTRTKAIAVVCGVLALVLGLLVEWNAFPFNADESLVYFVTHFYDLKPATLIMIAVGAAIGFWIPFRRSQEAADQASVV